jgi:hypothetical protein
MPRFEYEITKHPAEEFDQLVYFCTDQGECGVRELPPDQLSALWRNHEPEGSPGLGIDSGPFRKRRRGHLLEKKPLIF